jgi:hypothetical protein
MNPEVESNGQENLEEMEREDLETFIAKSEIDPNNPNENFVKTPMEHFLLGSTPFAGGAVHPNLTIAEVAGATLETINKAREGINQAEEIRRAFMISNEDIPYIIVRLLPLTPEQVSATNPIATFEVTGAMDIEGEKVSPPADISAILSAKMVESQSKAADLTRERHQKRQN